MIPTDFQLSARCRTVPKLLAFFKFDMQSAAVEFFDNGLISYGLFSETSLITSSCRAPETCRGEIVRRVVHCFNLSDLGHHTSMGDRCLVDCNRQIDSNAMLRLNESLPMLFVLSNTFNTPDTNCLAVTVH